MPESAGTRTWANQQHIHPQQGSDTRTKNPDKGMSKRVVNTLTFTASNGRITGSNGDFTSFKLNDEIWVEGTNLNNGYKTITGLDGVNSAYVVVDPAPKDESSVTTAVLRTA